MGRAYQNRKESMAKTSDANAKVYSRFSREIYMCAKTSGIDPDGNLALRSLLDKAKKAQVPSHVIDNALKKASGTGGENFAPARYEGYGPGNVMVIIECLTDNPNRTFGDVRACFTKTKATIGTQGSVAHMFDHLAVFVFDGDDEDTVLEALMEADVDVTDVECEDGKLSVYSPPNEYFKTKTALEAAIEGVDFDLDEIQWLPMNTSPIKEDSREVFERFTEMLNELDDVQHIYHNAEL